MYQEKSGQDRSNTVYPRVILATIFYPRDQHLTSLVDPDGKYVQDLILESLKDQLVTIILSFGIVPLNASCHLIIHLDGQEFA
jgi:hypothetical protein